MIPSILNLTLGNAYLSFTLFLIGLGIFFSIASVIQDKKDYTLCQKDIDDKH